MGKSGVLERDQNDEVNYEIQGNLTLASTLKCLGAAVKDIFKWAML